MTVSNKFNENDVLEVEKWLTALDILDKSKKLKLYSILAKELRYEKNYLEPSTIVTREELETYCNDNEMCNPVTMYKDMLIFAEYFPSKKDFYCIVIYKPYNKGKYICSTAVRCEVDIIGYDEYEGYNISDIYKIAQRIIDAMNFLTEAEKTRRDEYEHYLSFIKDGVDRKEAYKKAFSSIEW